MHNLYQVVNHYKILIWWFVYEQSAVSCLSEIVLLKSVLICHETHIFDVVQQLMCCEFLNRLHLTANEIRIAGENEKSNSSMMLFFVK